MVIATGIANIWARDPFTMTAAQLTLSEAYPERFLLGLGVSHARLVEDIRGHKYQQPFMAMRRYLDGMDQAARAYRAVKPAAMPPRVLAALGPTMLALRPSEPRALIRTLSHLSTGQRLALLWAPIGGFYRNKPWS